MVAPILAAVAMVAGLLVPTRAFALPLETYAQQSVLSSGRWVKISVAETGMHLLTPAALRQMGFTDIKKVRVYGYGAVRQPEKLGIDYVDDLPQVVTYLTDAGLCFYAVGPVSFNSGRPVQNPFTTLGYYFLTDSDADGTSVELGSTASPGAANPTDRYSCVVYHEQELVSPGHTGHLLVGENFLTQSTQKFRFTLADRVDNSITLYSSFVAKSPVKSYVNFTVNDVALPRSAADAMAPLTDGHAHYAEALGSKVANTDNDNVVVGVSYECTGKPSLANLNYLSISYTRALRLSGAQLQFTLASREVKLADADASTQVWDVTDPLRPMTVDAKLSGTDLLWTTPSVKTRNYVAFKGSTGLPAPKYCGTVSNQNLHGLEVPDMVIFTPREFVGQAERLAAYRRGEGGGLAVEVVCQDDVFNEFSSGAADVQAFRKMLKMMWDRNSSTGRPLTYALFFGRGTYDNRQLTPSIKATGYPKMPIWQTDRGANDSESYSTDDVFAFLSDGAGSSLSSDHYCIAVGRMPVTSVDDARNAVDKIIEYEGNLTMSNWRNRMLLVADDEDKGAHLDQTERMWNWLCQSDGGEDLLYNKLYLDLYPRDGSVARIAHDKLIKELEEGLVWLTYVGHANTTSWSHESLLTYTDINNLHLRRYPLIYAATCDFLKWDDNSISAAEIMWKLNGGGAIGVISANRPVYISENGWLTEAFGRNVAQRNADGSRPTLGQVYMRTKNDYKVQDRNGNYVPTANANKLKYVLLGDPALRPLVPLDRVVVETVNGVSLDDEDAQAVMMAMQDVAVTGHVADSNGALLGDFNGTINVTLYDAEKSCTTLALGGATGVVSHFDTHGDRLYEGYFPVTDGKFDFVLPMPSEIANNFRPATLAMMAYRSDNAKGTTAGSTENRLYAFGIDNSAVADTVAPVIESFYLNHNSFVDGSVVNTSPVVIAQISDNRAINMSSAGIGHQMVLKLDGGAKSYSDVSQYFTASTDGSPSGVIGYPLGTVSEGAHTLMLRVWDSAGNSASQTLTFIAKEDVAPVLYDVFTDANPATVEANFYLSHDRPESVIDVTVSVYNLMGKRLWSATRSGRSDLFLSFPITWDLTDQAGRPVGRGIYLYRASVTCDGVTSETRSRKIAVANRL